VLSDFDKKVKAYQETYQRILMRKIMIERNIINQYKLKLLHGSPQYRIKENRMYGIQISERLQNAIVKNIAAKKHVLELYITKLKGTSPLEKLSSGYAYATDEFGKVIKNIDEVSIGDRIEIAVRNGMMLTEVLKKEKVDRENENGTR
jgi:exodeoxyribonuclease VII large subunit